MKQKVLLIFDNDGTIIRSDYANWHASNFYLQKLGYQPNSYQELKQLLGNKASNYYPALIKSTDKSDWHKLQRLIEKNIPKFFKKYLKLYPEVIETLTELRKRGYKLVLYSNAPKSYFEKALKAKDYKIYFNFTQHLKRGYTKTSTIKSLRKKYHYPETFIIGDRIHDYQAAKNNKLKSVACTYGFGTPKEFNHADFKIKKFSDLLKIFK